MTAIGTILVPGQDFNLTNLRDWLKGPEFEEAVTCGAGIIINSQTLDGLTAAGVAMAEAANTAAQQALLGLATADSPTFAQLTLTNGGAGTFAGNYVFPNVTNSSYTFYGGSAGGGGAFVSVYGSAHATKANVVEIATGGGAVAASFSSAGALSLPFHGTTGSAANAHIDSSTGLLSRSTSSERYKKDIEPLDAALADAAISLQPIWYRSDPEKCPNDNPDWSFYGLSAEAVAKKDPRLVHWGYPDDAYEEVEVPCLVPAKVKRGQPPEMVQGTRLERQLKAGAQRTQPESVQYERVNLLRTEALLNRIAALEARLEAAGL